MLLLSTVAVIHTPFIWHGIGVSVNNDDLPACIFNLPVSQMDNLFEKCYQPLQRASNLVTYYQLMLRIFKQMCADRGLIHESKASLEDCIIAIKNALWAVKEIKLQVSKDVKKCNKKLNTVKIQPLV